MTTRTELRRAIEQSMQRNCSVSIETDDVGATLVLLAVEWDGEIDSVAAVEDGDGRLYTDVWGWTDETPEDQQDWRLRMYCR